MLNASVGVHRVLGRLRPDPTRRSARATSFHRRSLALAGNAHTRLASLAGGLAIGQAQRPRRAHHVPRQQPVRHGAHRAGLVDRLHPFSIASGVRDRTTALVLRRLGREQVVPLTVALLVLGAAVVSVPASNLASAATGGVEGSGATPRIVVGGLDGGDIGLNAGKLDWVRIDPRVEVDPGTEPAPPDVTALAGARRGEADADAPIIGGPFLADGTLLKPVAVDTTVADGKGLLRRYKVRAGDTLTAIANHFGISMMTVWWANGLTSKEDIHVGKTLVIPPMNGIIVVVKDGDTLDSIAAVTGGDAQRISAVNGLERPDLIVGQTLIIPDVLGKTIAAPKPRAKAKPAARAATSTRSNGGSIRPPARYTGGAFAWPVAGGEISQYFHYGHYAIDIAADYGTRVKSTAAGTVTFAGWKSNGGGYQVWIAHGSGLYTTYSHMSAVGVGRGQKVARGQSVGRIGQSGWATGPHLHFEVWRGPVWDGGTRVNPLGYL